MSRPGPAPGPAWTSRAEGGAGTSRADAPRIAPAELFRREIPRLLHPRPHGRAALVAAGPCAGPAWTSRAEGGAGTSRADAPRIAPAELFRREIPRLLHPRPHGRAALVAAGPCAGPAWMSRAEGGAGTSRADAPLVWECGISLRNCSDVKSRVPYTSATWEGRACRGRALRRPRPTPHPRPNPQPPTHGPACEVPEPPSARGVRTGLPRWLALTHEDPDIGRGARPARPPAPHAHARLGCWTPRRAPRRGRAAGDVGPYHCPARTHLASTILPPAPTRSRR